MRTMPNRVRTRTGPARTALLLLPLVVAASAGCDLAMADYKVKETAEWRKTYELQPGGRLEIRNVNGKIDVKPSAGNTVEIVAQKSARAASTEAAKQALERIEIQEDESPSGIRIETKVQRNAGGFFGGVNHEVQYVVRVPAGAEVKFSTVNGGIELTGLKGRINAETTNGGIKARDVTGSIDASTTNGGVDVELAAVGEAGVKLGCVNGGIELRLPSGLEGDDLGPRRERRHRHERTAARNDRNPEPPASRGAAERRRAPHRPRRRQRRHPDRRPVERITDR